MTTTTSWGKSEKIQTQNLEKKKTKNQYLIFTEHVWHGLFPDAEYLSKQNEILIKVLTWKKELGEYNYKRIVDITKCYKQIIFLFLEICIYNEYYLDGIIKSKATLFLSSRSSRLGRQSKIFSESTRRNIWIINVWLVTLLSASCIYLFSMFSNYRFISFWR